MRHKVSAEEYTALREYALHWLAGGLQGHLTSIDLDRIRAFDPYADLSEGRLDHKALYYAARGEIGFRPSFVADSIACHGYSLTETGEALGFKSAARGRQRAGELLSDAGSRLAVFFRNRR